MIKFLVLTFSILTVLRAEFTNDEDLIQKWLAAGLKETEYYDSSNETNFENCEDELTDVKVCLDAVSEKYSSRSLDFTSDRESVLAALKDLQNASCFNPTNCTNVKVGKYIFNTYFNVGTIVFDVGYDCLQKESKTIESKARQCLNQVLVSGEVKEASTDAFFQVLLSVSDCVIQQFQCSFGEKFALVNGAMQAISLAKAFLSPVKLLQAVGASESDLSIEELTSLLTYFMPV